MISGDERSGRTPAILRAPVLASLVLAVTFRPAASAEDIAPFPPGKNAALVKKICTSCHSATLVIDRRYDVAGAQKRYRLFVGNPASEEGKLVVEYLSTALGEE
jgi:hypothetical protein